MYLANSNMMPLTTCPVPAQIQQPVAGGSYVMFANGMAQYAAPAVAPTATITAPIATYQPQPGTTISYHYDPTTAVPPFNYQQSYSMPLYNYGSNYYYHNAASYVHPSTNNSGYYNINPQQQQCYSNNNNNNNSQQYYNVNWSTNPVYGNHYNDNSGSYYNNQYNQPRQQSAQIQQQLPSDPREPPGYSQHDPWGSQGQQQQQQQQQDMTANDAEDDAEVAAIAAYNTAKQAYAASSTIAKCSTMSRRRRRPQSQKQQPPEPTSATNTMKSGIDYSGNNNNNNNNDQQPVVDNTSQLVAAIGGIPQQLVEPKPRPPTPVITVRLPQPVYDRCCTCYNRRSPSCMRNLALTLSILSLFIAPPFLSIPAVVFACRRPDGLSPSANKYQLERRRASYRTAIILAVMGMLLGMTAIITAIVVFRLRDPNMYVKSDIRYSVRGFDGTATCWCSGYFASACKCQMEMGRIYPNCVCNGNVCECPQGNLQSGRWP